ncbi:hypothetical protein ACGFK1_16360 [Mycobacterium sp. NPDC048908]|uniref:hypothetical protein n=1 Tax=Mycobacterium sp. NPDC048908 TaxID=3364292 RepID=UPI00372114E3
MRAPLETCAKRGVVAVLASGMVISLTALTGGIAPAFAKPDTDQIVTTTAPAPHSKAPKAPIAEEAEPPAQQAPPKAQEAAPAAPSVDTPAPQQTRQVVEPVEPVDPVEPVAPTAPPVTQTTTAPVVTAVEPGPSATATPAAPKVESQAPRAVTPPPSEAPAAPTTAVRSAEPSAATEATTAASAPAATSAAPVLVAPSSAMDDVPAASIATSAPSTEQKPGSEHKPGEPKVDAEQTSSAAVTSGEPTVSVTKAAKVIEMSQPQTLDAPKADVELARNAKPVEVKADPAPKQDVDAMAKSIGLDLGVKGPLGVDANAKVDTRLASSRVFDRPVRQWRPDWVQYDEYYRPIIINPYHERVRIVYVYQNVPRIVWIPPLARAVLEVAQFAAYSFTAVVDTAANIANAAVNTALNVAVGSFFGGGYVPALGLPLPPPPPPVLRYDNVPVFVNYSNARYEPFRVRRVIDVGDDPRFGERKVLLDGATPAWGVWTQNSTGERQFEVHRTQQFPGLDDPQEAPLPGDYQLRLASDESPSGMTGRDIFLYVAAGVTMALGFGAIGLAFFLGRRRPQH